MANTKQRLGLAEVMKELKANGSEQTRKIYRSAGGAAGELFGVSYAFYKKLHKRIKTDHELALELWATNNLDARIMACWVADAEQTTIKLLETWARDDSVPMLSGELAAFVQDTDLAAGRMRKWMGMKNTYRRTMAWTIAGSLAMQPGRDIDEGGIDDKDLTEILERIASELQAAPQSVRYSMNNAIISVGCRPGWKKQAIDVARKVGKVEIDFGKRSCQVKDAEAAIEHAIAHYKKQGKNPTQGSGGKRRRHC